MYLNPATLAYQTIAVQLTSPSPSKIRSATKAYTLNLAAKGVSNVKAVVQSTPKPNTRFAPYFAAIQPPGS